MTAALEIRDLHKSFGDLPVQSEPPISRARPCPPRCNGFSPPVGTTRCWRPPTTRAACTPGSIGADTRTPYGDMAWDGDENAKHHRRWGRLGRPLQVRHHHRAADQWTASGTTRRRTPFPTPRVDVSAQRRGDGHRSDPDLPPARRRRRLVLQELGQDLGQPAMPLNKDTIGIMPVNWNWPYQLNQYELTTGTHRLTPPCLGHELRRDRRGRRFGQVPGLWAATR